MSISEDALKVAGMDIRVSPYALVLLVLKR